MKKSRNKSRKIVRGIRKRKSIKGGSPQIGLEVRYPTGIVRGQAFLKEDTKDAPQVHFNPEKDKLYTLLMWDPDAPAKPSWVHWIVTNLNSIEQIPHNTILSYQGPNPPSGTHRYYFGLFIQLHGKISPMISGIRGGFDYKEFIRENGLKKVGEVYFKVFG